ncbi:MAG: prepilin-type N-terminal cleavage/methylation domain-containing protein [Nitrospirae bacterium]|nr:MAG: prepilin-type N-terminal cleavage/methylation domain-containing protein [Nitrospirota bacterium]
MAKPRHDSGYTLVEMMIVVALLGILGAVAIPAYRGYVQTGKEAEAKAGLSNLALLEEQYFAENRTYVAGANAGALKMALGFNPDKDTKYTWSVAAGSTGDISTSFVATADGSANGLPVFTIDDQNNKTRNGVTGW